MATCFYLLYFLFCLPIAVPFRRILPSVAYSGNQHKIRQLYWLLEYFPVQLAVYMRYHQESIALPSFTRTVHIFSDVHSTARKIPRFFSVFPHGCRVYSFNSLYNVIRRRNFKILCQVST